MGKTVEKVIVKNFGDILKKSDRSLKEEIDESSFN